MESYSFVFLDCKLGLPPFYQPANLKRFFTNLFFRDKKGKKERNYIMFFRKEPGFAFSLPGDTRKKKTINLFKNLFVRANKSEKMCCRRTSFWGWSTSS